MKVRDHLRSFGYRWIGYWVRSRAGLDAVGRGVVRVGLVLNATADGTVQTVAKYVCEISMNFMVAPCINNIKHFIVQLMHSNYKILRLLK